MKLLFENWRKFVNEDEDKKEKIEKSIEDTLDDEGGAAGLEPLVKAAQKIDSDITDDEVKDMLSGLEGVDQHEKGDYIDTAQLEEVVKVYKEMKDDTVDEGKKDACYHKVKSRYKVWPSAYASGALVKCRKVGAKNWGTGGKKKK
jgi:hypothetical protein